MQLAAACNLPGCCHVIWLVQTAAQEAQWAKQIAASDSKADNAEGMAAAMNVSVRQLEAQLQAQQQAMATKDGALRLRSIKIGCVPQCVQHGTCDVHALLPTTRPHA